MQCKFEVGILTVFMLLAGATQAVCGEYNDPSGFSFTYPEGWLPTSSMNKGELPPEVRGWFLKNNVDFNRVSVFLVRVAQADFVETMNVVVQQQEMAIEEVSVKKLLDMMSQQFRSMGIKIEGAKGETKKFGTNQAIVIEFQSKLPAVPFPLRQRQTLFSGGGKTFVVTCTSKDDTFETYAPTFDKILTSFKVPPSTRHPHGIDFGQSLIMGIVGGLIGGIVGGLYALHKKIKSKKNPVVPESK
jgi:hypothetical protein